ncbi:MAG: GGDEF domain-containing protein [Lachnospiraceae bacterium]|nr:GGDEF domain-containing protein [Lachnospiraceae bacterium]
MDVVFMILGDILGSKITLFLLTMQLNLAAFYFVKRMIAIGAKVSRRWLLFLFAFLNSAVSLAMQSSSGGHANLLIISFLSAFFILEMALLYRANWWPYLNIYWMSAMLLQCSYLVSCAIVNLKLYASWEIGSSSHRYAIFSMSMLISSLVFICTAKTRASFLIVLSDLIHDRSRSLLLVCYSAISTVVQALSGRLISKLLYAELPDYVKEALYLDILLKNVLILGGSFLIVFFLIKQEQSNQRSMTLEQNLQTERDFRGNLQSNALFSYCANVTRDRFVEGFGTFTFDPEEGYNNSIMNFIMDSVHPEDMDILTELATPESYEKHLEEEPNFTLRIRMAPRALLSIPDFRPPKEALLLLSSNREWIWVEFRITTVRESVRGDILIYVSLCSVDKEMSEREMLIHAANTDPLTGLLNRSGLEELLQDYLNEKGASGALFIIDMDYFKSVNDLLGHPTGDKVLQEMADTLNTVFRERDVISRLGGDEFCVFAHNMTDKELVARRAHQLNECCRRTYSSEDDKINVQVSLSIGIAICNEEEKRSYQTLYSQADTALYEAKAAGRNTYRISA